ncbi:hypothetical protein BZG36_00001, partial [Bifiguratus adelaidae]
MFASRLTRALPARLNHAARGLRTTPALQMILKSSKVANADTKDTGTQTPQDALDRLFTVKPLSFWMDRLSEANTPLDAKKAFKPRQLLLKKMEDSYMVEYLPFKSDPYLLEEYVAVDGTIKLGKVLEDLDALAGAVSYKHVSDGNPDSAPVTIVTASMDRLDILLPKRVADYKLSGHVSYVGYSSMEIFIRVETMDDYDPSLKTKPIHVPQDITRMTPNTVLQARFTMVARDPRTGKAVQVNPLLLESASQKRLFQRGEELKAHKRASSEMALDKKAPTTAEQALIHQLYLEGQKYIAPKSKQHLPSNMEWMENTAMNSVHIMTPQDRNIHGFIFGGYLMRRAYELAWANAAAFTKSRPVPLSLDDITFRKPVPIGTLLDLSSHVVYSEGSEFCVSVVADVMDFTKDARETTNIFNFTFQKTDGNPVSRVMPRTYAFLYSQLGMSPHDYDPFLAGSVKAKKKQSTLNFRPASSVKETQSTQPFLRTVSDISPTYKSGTSSFLRSAKYTLSEGRERTEVMKRGPNANLNLDKPLKELANNTFGRDGLAAKRQRVFSPAIGGNIFHKQIAGSADQPQQPEKSSVEVQLSFEQKYILDLVIKQGESIFFTGSAGTGKSVLLREIIRMLRGRNKLSQIAVTASTGIAACNIGGITLHSFAGIGMGADKVEVLVKRIRSNKRLKRRWEETRVLIIDEVSMVDGGLFDKIEQIAREVRGIEAPFGGIQIVLAGDFFQLPPVDKSGGARLTFEAESWKSVVRYTIALKKIFRQKNSEFAHMLNELRLGTPSPYTIETFKKLSRKPLGDFEPTRLFALRSQVENANSSRLASLPGKEYHFTSLDEDTEKIDKVCIAPKELVLKIGAQVMLLKNVDNYLVNGSIGVIESFAKPSEQENYDLTYRDNPGDSRNDDPRYAETEWPVVRFRNNIKMLFSTALWEMRAPQGELVASRRQVPLCLAWALSIHKAQGQTLDSVQVDLGRVFEKGQAYVALSRATSLEGLQVLNFDAAKVMAHPKRVFSAGVSMAEVAAQLLPQYRTHYGLTRKEVIQGLANSFMYSNAYIVLYLAMAGLSVVSIILSLTESCPSSLLVFIILEIIINVAMILEVGVRLVALGRNYWTSLWNLLDILLVLLCISTLIVISHGCTNDGLDGGQKGEEIFDTILLVFRNVAQFVRVLLMVRKNKNTLMSRSHRIDFSDVAATPLFSHRNDTS